MKLFRFGLNVWITIVSLLSFLIGWVALAHSPKPVSHTAPQVTISSAAPLPTLTPLQFGGTDNSSNNQNFTFQQAPSSNFNNGFTSAPQPIFRTGGS